jgi:hypothetical protein
MAKSSVTFPVIVFVCVLAGLMILFPFRESFVNYTIYGEPKNKPKGAKCKFFAECASNDCLPYTSSAGSMFTCA